MVDFRKLLDDRKQREKDAHRTTTKDPRSRAQVHSNCDRKRSLTYGRRDLGPDINRELEDAEYMLALMASFGTHAG